ncbi:kinesin-like protein KIN-5D [Balamuthia mandrillaris]
MSARSKKTEAKTKPVNVQVFLRCRPMNPREVCSNLENVVQCSSLRKEVSVQLHHKKSSSVASSSSSSINSSLISASASSSTATLGTKSKTFTFDDVFGPDSTQRDVYNTAIAPIVEEVLKGFNCTVFAYGQTGTGKTHTMEGNHANGCWSGSEAGVIPRAIHQIFDSLEVSAVDYSVRVSFLELYNEELFDLLAPDSLTGAEEGGNGGGGYNNSLNNGGKQANLRIFDDATRGITVSPLEEVHVSNAQDIFTILEKSYHKRRTAETQLNHNSSRSHCIFSIVIHTREATPEGEDLVKVGKLNLVDLAGSENIGRSGAVKERKREAGMINTSLLTLGRVITALTEHQNHVPYRESKLTRLLQDSLGGKTKTCIIATVSPSSDCIDETLSTLDYAHRAKNIRNRPEVNQKMTKKALMKECVETIERLRQELHAQRCKEGVFLPQDRYETMEQTLKTQRDNLDELEARLQAQKLELEKLENMFQEKEFELRENVKQHNQTKALLAETEALLQETKEILRQKEVELLETNVVVQEHEKVEQKLHQEANALISRLGETVEDIGGLHGKIERSLNVMSENEHHANSFYQRLSTRIQSLEERLCDWKQKQGTEIAELERSVSSFADTRGKEMKRLEQEAKGMLVLLAEKRQQLVSSVHLHNQQTTGTLASLSTEEEAHAQQLEHRLVHLSEEAERTISDLSQTVERQRAELCDWHERVLLSHFSSASQQVSSFVQQQESCVQTVHQRMEELAAKAEESSRQKRTLLERFVEEQQSKTEQMQQALMQQVAAFMQSFVVAQQKSMAESVEDLMHSISRDDEDIRRMRAELQQSTQQIGKQALDMRSLFLQKQSETEKSTATVMQQMEEQLFSASQQSCSTITSHLSSSINSIRELSSSHHALQRDVHMKNCSSALNRFVEEQSECLVQLEKEGEVKQSALAASMEDVHSETVASCEQWKQRLGEFHRVAVEQHCQEQVETMKEVDAAVDQYRRSLKKVVPTGQTPQKSKAYRFSRNLSRVPPRETILKQYYSQEQGEGEGEENGDVFEENVDGEEFGEEEKKEAMLEEEEDDELTEESTLKQLEDKEETTKESSSAPCSKPSSPLSASSSTKTTKVKKRKIGGEAVAANKKTSASSSSSKLPSSKLKAPTAVAVTTTRKRAEAQQQQPIRIPTATTTTGRRVAKRTQQQTTKKDSNKENNVHSVNQSL